MSNSSSGSMPIERRRSPSTIVSVAPESTRNLSVYPAPCLSRRRILAVRYVVPIETLVGSDPMPRFYHLLSTPDSFPRPFLRVAATPVDSQERVPFQPGPREDFRDVRSSPRPS